MSEQGLARAPRMVSISYELLLDLCTKGNRLIAVDGHTSVCVEGVSGRAKVIGTHPGTDGVLVLYIDDPEFDGVNLHRNATPLWRREVVE